MARLSRCCSFLQSVKILFWQLHEEGACLPSSSDFNLRQLIGASNQRYGPRAAYYSHTYCLLTLGRRSLARGRGLHSSRAGPPAIYSAAVSVAGGGDPFNFSTAAGKMVGGCTGASAATCTGVSVAALAATGLSFAGSPIELKLALRHAPRSICISRQVTVPSTWLVGLKCRNSSTSTLSLILPFGVDRLHVAVDGT